MLKKDKNGSTKWLDKLPQRAKQLEEPLYRNARSLDDYTNMSTLKQRLQLTAMEVSRKAKSGGSSSSSGRSGPLLGGDSQCFDAPEGVPQSNEFKGKHIFVRECYPKYYDDILKLLNSDGNDV